MRKISVAVPVPFLDLLTYSVPDHIGLPPVGARVRVPVGARTLTGCVVEHLSSSETPTTELKDVVEVLDLEPLVPQQVVELCRWVADYYVAGVGDAMASAMPPGAQRKASSFRTRRVATITAHGLEASRADAGTPGLTPKQREALGVLAAATAGLPQSELRDRGISGDVLGRLAARGYATLRSEASDRDPFERAALSVVDATAPRELTTEQTAAFEHLAAV